MAGRELAPRQAQGNAFSRGVAHRPDRLHDRRSGLLALPAPRARALELFGRQVVRGHDGDGRREGECESPDREEEIHAAMVGLPARKGNGPFGLLRAWSMAPEDVQRRHGTVAVAQEEPGAAAMGWFQTDDPVALAVEKRERNRRLGLRVDP